MNSRSLAWPNAPDTKRLAPTLRAAPSRSAAASSRQFDPNRLKDFLAARGVEADVEVISEAGDAAALLLGAARRVGASLLVSGAFGHARLREFIFGGATRSFLQAESPSLFLSH